jgi:dTDP-4-amino-4,6-dideoxygalactose transaminase
MGDLPVCEQVSRETLSLPVYPSIPAEHVERIAQVVLQALPE